MLLFRINMAQKLAFFKKINSTESFSQSEFSQNDIPDHPIDQAVLLSHLERHYVPLSKEDMAEYVFSKVGLDGDIGDITRAIDFLSVDEIITRTEEGKYKLNTDRDLVRTIQDARTEYLIEEKF